MVNKSFLHPKQTHLLKSVGEGGRNISGDILWWKWLVFEGNDKQGLYHTRWEEFPQHKSLKNKINLWFGGNASGDYKVKTLLIYLSENLRSFYKHNVQKCQLPVWRSNSNVWVTGQYFRGLFNIVFGSRVKRSLGKNCLWRLFS